MSAAEWIAEVVGVPAAGEVQYGQPGCDVGPSAPKEARRECAVQQQPRLDASSIEVDECGARTVRELVQFLVVLTVAALLFRTFQAELDRGPGYRTDHILIAATHTHSAPDCYAFPDGKGGHTGDLKYMDFVCVKAAEALNAAFDGLQPAVLKIATAEARGKIVVTVGEAA